MTRVGITTNAVCDLSPQDAEALGVVIIPECIIFDNTPYLSFVDFQPRELYQMLEETKRRGGKSPTGSQPNIGMYLAAFESFRDSCDEVICLNMTSRMSGSFTTAMLAKTMLEKEAFPARIHIFDSLELSHGLGFLVRLACRLADEGADAEEILAQLTEARSKIGTYFVLRSLEDAARGGRLGNIRAGLADAFDLKPVLMFRDGIDSDVAIAHTFKQALRKLPAYYEKQAEFGRQVCVFHADNLEGAESVKAQIESIDPAALVSIEWLGSGIGIYTGIGAVGVTFWEC